MRVDLKLRKLMKKKGIKSDKQLGEVVGEPKSRISNTMGACDRIEGWYYTVSQMEDAK